MENKKEDMEMTEIELKVVREWIEKLQKAIEVLEVKLTKHTVKYDYEKNIKDEKQADEYQRFEKEISDLEDKIKSNNLPSSIQTLFDESEILKKNFPKKFKEQLISLLSTRLIYDILLHLWDADSAS